MIIELKIKNVALISELTFQPQAGLTILTGETGAGKSILLGSLSLILGERASSDLIRANCEAAMVEGLFDISTVPGIDALLEEHGLPGCEEGVLLLKREFFKNERGKCYVNGSLTTLAILQKIGVLLVDLHGQHAHQSLMHKENQRDLLDLWAGLDALKNRVAEKYLLLKQSKEAQAQLALNESQRTQRIDLLKFQIKEIDDAQIKPGELVALNEEREKLVHAERLINTIQSCLEVLHRQEEHAVHDGLGAAVRALSGIVNYDSSLSSLVDDLRSAEALVDDVVNRLGDFVDGFEADPNRLEWVEERLDLLQKMKRKYGHDEETILAFQEEAVQELENLSFQDEALEKLANKGSMIAEQLSGLAHELSTKRMQAGQVLSQKMAEELKTLGFNQAAFMVKVLPKEDPEGWIKWEDRQLKCSAHGADDIEFLIAPNPGEAPKPVAKTASGGELSRIMLAIKVIASQATSVPTMIFDEVDAGIGGATAEAVGKRLQLLAEKRQIIVITHLPQIARFAKKHFQVKKEVSQGRTVTNVVLLTKEEQIKELARLLAGDHLTDTALKHAEELIQ